MAIRCNIRGECDVARMRREQERNVMSPRHHTRWMWSLVMLLAIALPVLAACGSSSDAGKLPSGWSWYTDSRFPFRVPVPPQWQAGSFVWTSGGINDCEYHVDLIPPGNQGGADIGAESNDPVIMVIVVKVQCPPWRGTLDDRHYIAEPNPVTISGVQATMYDNDDAYGIQRTATTQFGGHQYLFHLQYNFGNQGSPSKAQQDQELALYMQMLQGFQYTGK